MIELPPVEASVEPVSLDSCERWLYDGERIRHETGRFFSVMVARRDGVEQLLLDQPERGILGIIVAPGSEGSNSFLLQRKVEPGNDPLLQYSPTVQATKSNYERVHGGAPTAYLEYFTGSLKKSDFDVLHSEQGSKFVQKFNRNLMTTVDDFEAVEVDPNFDWLSAAQTKELLWNSTVINTDARSVIVSGNWRQLGEPGREPFAGGAAPAELQQPLQQSYATVRDEVLADVREFLLRRHETAARGEIERLPIHKSTTVVMSDHGVHTTDGAPLLRYFDIRIADREVAVWHQPLYCQAHVNRVALAIRVVDGLAEFLLTAEPEIGFADRVELSPSVHATEIGDYQHAVASTLGDDVVVLGSLRQTDEGGRFYQCYSRYELLLVPGDTVGKPQDQFRWLSAGELQSLCLETGYVSHEARMLISIVLGLL